MHSFTRHCAWLESSGKHFSSYKEHERAKLPTNLRDAPLLSSSAVRIDLETQQSHHLEFVIQRGMLKERRKLTEIISPWRFFITQCSALISSNAWCYCAAWCFHVWRFPKSKTSDVVQKIRIRPVYLQTHSPESALYEWSSAVKKWYIFPMKTWFAGTGKKYSMCCIVMG